ncbi:MAG TPA: [protein-PII] uridylyltransferase [Ignavibacteriaceae bacterium]|nr:[protein-PII] uridylyltransferase [Ignavibacteriaceae bacterium]
MSTTITAKQEFINKREDIFRDKILQKDSFNFCMAYSLLVEDHIRSLAKNKKYKFAITSAGSFSRRELSPYSDIDIMFISDNVEENKEEISELVKIFWDNGLEASHTVREFSDITKYLTSDLHSFTQFFETRLLCGSVKTYNEWNKILFDSINHEDQIRLFKELRNDIELRYKKYGESPKLLEPNVKMSAGGLRDFQAIEWMFILSTKTLLNKQNEITQAESFIDEIKKLEFTTPNECNRILGSYKLVLEIRNHLHILNHHKSDRFEFNMQENISALFYNKKNALSIFMKEYFLAANAIYRFTRSMSRRFDSELSNSLPDSLGIELDENFSLKGKKISFSRNSELILSDIIRLFYYRCLYNAFFDEKLTCKIIETVDNVTQKAVEQTESSVFFREILRLPRSVGNTLSVMNELGVLGAFLTEWNDLVGFMQHGVYHCYTTDEHTIVAIQNLEKLEKDSSPLGKIFNKLKNKEILYLALLFHDIAKPINISGHEIIGAEMASSIMQRLGYDEKEIEPVTFLVRNHLIMEQVAFRRNLNDPETLNNFSTKFNSIEDMDLLYLLTYADLSAVNSAVWTSWKSDLLAELYSKSKAMLERKISGEEYLISNTYIIPKEISKHSPAISEEHVQEHIDSINDIAYSHQFSDQEIAMHVEAIQKGESVSTLFNELNDFTNITVITKDFPSLLSKLCGVLSINDLNIHDAKIFTRKDGIVIDTFNVTDFRTNKVISKDRYQKINHDLSSVVKGLLKLNAEITQMKSKWWRIESKFFKRKGKVNITFEDQEKYTIIDIFSPDRLGFLYQVTSKMNELGLIIYFAKISTRSDDIVDSFYVLDRHGKKISGNDYNFIKAELNKTISLML